MDHVIPTAAGGKWTWENLVTACTLCNCRKGSKSVEQLGWKLRKKPAVSRLPLSLCVQPHSPSHVRDENRVPVISHWKVCLCCVAQGGTWPVQRPSRAGTSMPAAANIQTLTPAGGTGAVAVRIRHSARPGNGAEGYTQGAPLPWSKSLGHCCFSASSPHLMTPKLSLCSFPVLRCAGSVLKPPCGYCSCLAWSISQR